jgi:hypothetical protein
MVYPEVSNITKQYWGGSDFQMLSSARSINEVYAVAVSVLSKMPESVAQVCGPISSGGRGSIEENLKYLNQVIFDLQEKGVAIFDQMPFEETIHRIINDETTNQKYENILYDFYEPLFTLNRIKTLYFVPGWESSRGANWEHNKASELGITISYL